LRELISVGENAKNMAQDILNIKKNNSNFKHKAILAFYAAIAIVVGIVGFFVKVIGFKLAKFLLINIARATAFVAKLSFNSLAQAFIWTGVKWPVFVYAQTGRLFSYLRNVFPKEKMLGLILKTKMQLSLVWNLIPKELVIGDVASKINLVIANFISRFPIGLSMMNTFSNFGAQALSFLSRLPAGSAVIGIAAKALAFTAAIKMTTVVIALLSIALTIVIVKLAQRAFANRLDIRRILYIGAAGIGVVVFGPTAAILFSLYMLGKKVLYPIAMNLEVGEFLDSSFSKARRSIDNLTAPILNLYWYIPDFFVVREQLLMSGARDLNDSKESNEQKYFKYPAYSKQGAQDAKQGIFGLYNSRNIFTVPMETGITYAQGFVAGLRSESPK
jgi:hypothetical protein